MLTTIVVPRPFFRATPLLRLDLAFTAHKSSPLQDSANPEVIPFVRIAQHGIHVESHAVVSDGDPKAFGVDVQPHGDPSRFCVPLHIAESLLHNAKQEDLGTRK
jgi:hypothetical protein